MTTPAYTKRLCWANSLAGGEPTEIGAPPAGFTWVLRDGFMTYGSYFGFVRGAISVDALEPWCFIFVTPIESIVNVAHATIEWHGRFVVPAGQTLYFKTLEADTVDVTFSGYELSASGF